MHRYTYTHIYMYIYIYRYIYLSSITLQKITCCLSPRTLFRNKLRRYPQQPQRFIFTKLSEHAAKPSAGNTSAGFPRVKWTGLASATFSGTRWTWLGFAQRLPGTFSGTFSGTFPGTLLNLIWLCTKASHTFSGTFSGTLLNLTCLALHQSLPHLLLNPVEPDLALHQSLPDLLRNLVEPDLALHQSFPDLLRNLLRKLLRNPVEPDPAPAPVHTGAILGWRPH